MLIIPIDFSLFKNLKIPLYEINFTFVRSSGPGGQNVNKVNSKAVLRWNLNDNSTIPNTLKLRILEKLKNQLNDEGEIVLTSDRFRDQLRNKADCLEKLSTLIDSAVFIPKVRKNTKPSKSSMRRVKESKSINSEKKSRRGKVDF